MIRERKNLAAYKLSRLEFESLWQAQCGLCAICRVSEDELAERHAKTYTGRPSPAARLQIDHNHVTGAIRGLLCARCNAAMSWIDAIELERLEASIVEAKLVTYDFAYRAILDALVEYKRKEMV